MSRAPLLRRLTLLLLAAGLGDHADAGKLRLKSGVEISGTPVNVAGLSSRNAAANLGQNVPQTPYWVADDGIRRYFVHRQNLLPAPDGVDHTDDTSRYVRFEISAIKRKTEGIPIWVGAFTDATPWDEYGRRRVTLSGDKHVQLAITLLDPRYLKVESTSHDWTFGITPNTMPLETLTKVLHSAIDPRNPDQRLGIVRYFLQSEQYAGARAELEAMRGEFPELEARLANMQQELFELYGGQALGEIAERRAISQHGLARYVAQRMLQEDFSAVTLSEARVVLDEYTALDQRIAEARMLLSSVQGELSAEDAALVGAIRSNIEQELNYDTLPRLEPFLRVASAPQVPAAEKLALAYSGWLLGASQALTSFREAVALWEARYLLLEYLHPQTDRGDRQLLLKRLTELEGVSVPVVARMVPQLPMPVESLPRRFATQQIVELDPTLDSDVAVRYAILTPPEYNPARAYPAVVVLRPEGRTIEETLTMWGGSAEKPGPAQRRGYILIAPDFAPAAAGNYDYGKAAHDIVLRSLYDARQRVHIDSDRVFLAGHGLGGDAAYDIGLAHPDLWAGVIPVCGQFQHAAFLMRLNGPQLPFYVIGGERDRNTLDANAGGLAARMQRGWDLIYCEFKQRGFELYLEELPRVFDWMAKHRRPHAVRQLEQSFVRDFDNRVGWLKWVDLPPQLSQPVVWGEDKAPRVYSVEAAIPTPETLFVTRQPGKHTVLWLNPELVDYEKVLKIRISSATPFRDFPQPDLGVLLDDLRERGDRQMLYWTRLAF